MSNWIDNNRNIFITLGATNHTEKERQNEDFYATESIAIDGLKKVFDIPKNVWECACVDSETEYFNGFYWKKISDYTENDKVLCFDGKNGILLKPNTFFNIAYDDIFYHYESKDIDMMLTPDHNVLYRHRRNNCLCFSKMEEIFSKYNSDSNGFRGKILTTFSTQGDLHLDEWYLRLAVACNADGDTRTKTKKTFRIRLKKERKRNRLKFLLENAKITYKYSEYNGYYIFVFESPLGCKHFPKEWINLDNECKNIFMDEIYRWDGHCGKDKTKYYFSSKKEDVDIVQYISHSIGIQAKIDVDIRQNQNPNYRIVFKNKTEHALTKTNGYKFEICKSDNKYKYCFNVDTGMLILRRNNKIFITGNCGQGHLSKRLEELGHNVESTDLIDRGFGIGGVDFLKCEKLSPECGCILTNPPYKYATEFVIHALDLLTEGGYCVMFLKTTFLEGQKRYNSLFSKNPPKYVFPFVKRVQCAKNADFEGMKNGGGSAVSFSWFVWEKGYKGDTIVKWIN